MAHRPNMCTVDRIARTLIGVALLYVGFVDAAIISSDLIGYLVGALGAINVGSALLAYCPVYSLANVSTLRPRGQQQHQE